MTLERSSSFFWQADDQSYGEPETATGFDSTFDSTLVGSENEPLILESSTLIPPTGIPGNYGIIGVPRANYPMLSPLVTRRQVALAQSSIRFQVVVWYVGEVDVRSGTVPMRFRATLFWNDMTNDKDGDEIDTQATTPDKKRSKSQPFMWAMNGRQHACLKELDVSNVRQIDVPPLSILNAVSFDVIGQPEISFVKEETKLMRWSCMYSAVLMQENMRVDNFPHDQHDLVITLGILAHRNPGKRWDRNKWRLQLAKESDSHGSTRVPYGLLVDQVSIPGFHYKKDSLGFSMVPQKFGSGDHQQTDECLQVKLTVFRDAGHYDKNVMPLMILLNIVAITCLPRHFANNTGSTELMLSIAFVEIGFRLSIDNSLPSVGYQIKMQQILNK